MSGFFLLSGFLLTYRLIKELHKPNSNSIIVILKYAIRRFFRIYAVVVIFTFMAINVNKYLKTSQYSQIRGVKETMLLQFNGLNILWSIPSEIRYYFVIPIISLIFSSIKRLQLYFFLAAVAWTIYDQFFNFFGITWDGGISSGSRLNYLLEPHFFVFFSGSVLAMGYFLAQQSETIQKRLNNHKVQVFLVFASIILTIYTAYCHSGFFFIELDYK